MTEQQLIALKWPCFLAVETAHPRFGRAQAMGSIIVTVNSGYE